MRPSGVDFNFKSNIVFSTYVISELSVGCGKDRVAVNATTLDMSRSVVIPKLIDTIKYK